MSAAPGMPLGVLLSRPGHGPAQLALMAAAAAAALGRPVTLFVTGEATALLSRPDPFAGDPREALAAARGVATVAELLEAARAMGVRLLLCDAALRMAGAEAPPGAEVAGLVTFLSAVGQGPVLTF
ncbi:DsrE family protein [Roseococcus sp. DSY-14]|uniref:DsrE family protein n=1 Tax=Roseococcus sp. DSY-14 TaxID=3369650 RepID=UPI00387A8509